MENLKECVEFYKSLGFSIIPICYGDKRPDWRVLPEDDDGKRRWEPYQRRKPTDEEIENWFMSGENRNVGVVLGAVSNNAFVIDLDSPELVEHVKSKAPELFKNTLVVESRRGVHLYFFADKPVKSMKFKHKLGEIDIKGEGGYVLAPPSLHPSGKYYRFINKTEPMKAYSGGLSVDDFLRAFFRELFPELYDELERKIAGDGVIAQTPQQKTKLKFPDMPPCLKTLLDGVEEGRRNESCFLLAAYLSKILPVDVVKDLMLNWNERNSPPLNEREVIRTVESASKYEISCKAIKDRMTFDSNICDNCKYKNFMSPVRELYSIELEEEDMELIPTPEKLQKYVFTPMLRNGQLEAISELLYVDKGMDVNNFILKAPTGFGKTIVFLAKAFAEAPALIVEPYRPLQDQLREKYGLFVVKGKSNYKCPIYEVTADLAPCNYGLGCVLDKEEKEERCPYKRALKTANDILDSGGVVVVNHGNYNLFYNKANIIIFDEFHRILEALTKAIRLYSVDIDSVEKYTVEELINREIEALSEEIVALEIALDRCVIGSKDYNKIARKINRLRHKKRKLEFILENVDGAYVYWKEITKKDGSKDVGVYVKLDEVVVFKRILKWKKKKVLVSATPPAEPDDADVLVIEGFADFINRKNAPIIYLPIQKLTYWSVKSDVGKLKLAADFIKLFFGYLKNNGKTTKAIVHCGNVHMHGRKLAKFLQPRKVILHEKGNLDETLKKFKEEDVDFLIIASGDVGFDFYGDDYTVQFIAKVPYPAWDEEWKARARKFGHEETIRLYNKKTVDTLLQICGRICRGGDDVGYTIIIDSKFEDLFREYYDYFDEWFKSRLVDLSPSRVLEKIMKEKENG